MCISHRSADEKDSVVKALRQVTRDHNWGRHSLSGGAKFNAKKTYQPYGGSRVKALGRPKRALGRPSAMSEDESFDKNNNDDDGDDDDGYIDLK